MKILMAASEATPYAKTGGLADVIGALPFSLKARGEDVAVAMPRYRSAAPFLKGAVRAFDRMRITLSPALKYEVDIRRIVDRDVSFYFVDCPELFDRPALYGESGADYPDNHVRFCVFSHAVLGIVRSLFRPAVLHCHDWQASLVPSLMRSTYRTDPTFFGIKTLLTIHNLGYQGIYPRSAVQQLGIPSNLFVPSSMEFWGNLNFLKGGIAFSDALNTVSKAYAREIQTKEYGFGLDGLLRSRADVLTGIVNGVDYREWSPGNDSYIAAPYSVDSLEGKRICKQDLLQTFGFPAGASDRPVIGIVSRFAAQKGFDLIEEIGNELAREDILLIAIGTGEPRYEAMFGRLAEAYPDKVGVRVTYDNELAHKIEAGADMFLMPSRYEPCGLNQIYSLRYGTIPIVRATGGLDDTINDGNGFKFREYSGQALLSAVRSALAAYRDRAKWQKLVRTAMQADYSWDASAAEYSALYRRITG
jgi:starch synthase